jgi:hypothetical protein
MLRQERQEQDDRSTVRALLTRGAGVEMTSRLLIAGTVAAGSIAAAGFGGYLAVRTATHTSAAAPAITAPVPAPQSPEGAVPAAVPPQNATPQAPGNRRIVPRPAEVRASVRQADRNAPVAAAEPPLSAPEPVSSVTPVEAAADTPGQTAIVASAAEVALDVQPRFDIYELPANSVIGIQLDQSVSSETAQVEDPVRARVSRAVVVDGHTVIPTGTRLDGIVTLVERGGRMRDRARIGLRFSSVTVNGVRIPLQTDTIYREGDAPGGEATAKIGASAVVGSILGGVFGGKKGAAIGGAAGAAGGTAMVVAGGRNAAALASGIALTVRLTEPVDVRVDR